MKEEFEVDAIDVREPNFAAAGKVHDWRNYIGERTRNMWGTFSIEQRLALALDASDRASNEDWD